MSTTTTLAAAIANGSAATIYLASVTGVTAQATSLLVGQEIMGVNSVIGKGVNVTRGLSGTVPILHASGATVYVLTAADLANSARGLAQPGFLPRNQGAEGMAFPDGTLQTTAAAAAGPILTATVTLSAAQMKSLVASPVQLVTAPGAGKYIEVVDAALQYKGGSVPYTLDQPNGVLLAQWGASPLDVNGPFESVSLQGFLDQLTNKVQNHLLNNGLTHNQTDVANKGLFMTYGSGGVSGELTLGDGTLTVTVYYTVITLA